MFPFDDVIMFRIISPLKCNRIIENQRNVKDNISNFPFSTVPADGARTSAGTVMTKFVFRIYITWGAYLIFI